MKITKIEIFLVCFIGISLLFTLFFPQKDYKQYSIFIYIIDALIFSFLVFFKKKK